jgi:hypothetical protein
MAKRALLIGINRYQIPGADLRGCVNDVQNLRQALVQYCGFSAGNIKTQLDLRATKKNMQSGIESLLKGAKSGDVLLLHSPDTVPTCRINGDEAISGMKSCAQPIWIGKILCGMTGCARLSTKCPQA